MKRKPAAPAPDPPDPHAAHDPHDPHEVARLNREQPPLPIPRRSYAPAVPGLVALSVLGGRVVRRD